MDRRLFKCHWRLVAQVAKTTGDKLGMIKSRRASLATAGSWHKASASRFAIWDEADVKFST
jgi:hypothetical protein